MTDDLAPEEGPANEPVPGDTEEGEAPPEEQEPDLPEEDAAEDHEAPEA